MAEPNLEIAVVRERVVLTGRVVGMAAAEAYGLLQCTAAADGAEAAALELAAAVAAAPAAGIRTITQMFRELESSEHRVAYENERLMEFQRHGGGLPTG